MPFSRVDPERAGPTALGILVPLGQKTLVILRPRALAWDLLPARWGGEAAVPPAFCSFLRDEAAQVARRLLYFLDQQAVGAASPVYIASDAQARNFQLWVRTDEFVWIACRRRPRKAYQPVLFDNRFEAISAAQLVEAVVWPAADR